MILVTIFYGVQSVLMIVMGFFLLYLAFLTLLAFFYKEKKEFSASRHRRFAVVVPAHNEALIIGTTLQNLKELEYPAGQVDIIVIADNCTDETAAIALRCGTRVLERKDPDHRGKGYALRWCFDQLLTDRRSYEAVVVIDADSVVDHNFLTVMNHYLELGAKAVQCSDLAEQGSEGWTIEMIQLSFLLYNYVRPLGRAVIGCSAGLKGNGMCFAMDTVRMVPWSSFTTNEDLEHGLELLLHRIPVRFAPEAKLFAKMPHNADNARSQRARWEAGRFPVIKRFAPLLILGSIKRGSYILFDALVELMTPSLVNMLAVTIGMVLLNVMLFFIGVGNAFIYTFLWSTILMFGIVHVILGIVAGKGSVSSFKSLLFVPRYFLWKLSIYKDVSGKGHAVNEWVRTTREPATPKGSTKDSDDPE